jgi:hypothetical protein
MSVVIRDRTTPSQQVAVDTDGSLIAVLRDGTTNTQKLAIASDGSLIVSLKDATTGSQKNAVGVDGSLLVQPQALVKGTQGANGFSVQDLKDSGRVNIAWTVNQFSAASAAEALLTVTESRDLATATTFTTKVITSGKRLRITSLTFTVGAGGSAPAAIMRAYIALRGLTTGSTTASSPIQYRIGTSVAVAVNSTSTVFIAFPDGIEFLGDGTKTIGWSAICPDWVTGTSIPILSMSATAFEY